MCTTQGTRCGYICEICDAEDVKPLLEGDTAEAIPAPLSDIKAATGTDWAIDNGTLTISTNAGMADWITNGLDAHRDTLITTILSENITAIDDDAFYECRKLSAITAPNVTTIGDSAFYYCTTLLEVAFPEVATVGSNAFVDCRILEKISLPKATIIEAMGFYGTKLKTVSLPLVTTIGKAAFAHVDGENQEALTAISPPNVTQIDAGAFRKCRNLASISLPKTVPTVNSTTSYPGGTVYPFEYCKTPRIITFVDENGTELTGQDKADAISNYTAAGLLDDDQGDGLWYGWKLEGVPSYDIFVGSTLVDENNKGDVLGNGQVSYTPANAVNLRN